MKIEKITIKSFGHLSNMTLDFADGINVIEGQNEAGKSTIAAFIKYMLFGFEATEEPGTVGERKKRINWDTGIADGSMTVDVKGKKYLITRSTVATDNGGRVAYKEDSAIIDLENGTPAFGKLPAGEVFFGVDRELFENTAFLGQLGDTAIRETTVKESIENILFSGSEKINTQRASNLIALKMDTLLHQGNTGGAIIDLIKKQEELEERLRKTDEDNKQILAKEAELHEIRAKREAAETKRDKFLELDQCYRNVMLIQTFDKLHELEEECAKRTDVYNSFIKENTTCDFVPGSEYLTDIALARRGIEECYRRLGEAQNVYAKEKSAVGITKEIESAIELADKFGGEGAVKEKVQVIESNKIKCIAGGIAAAIAFLVCGILALLLSADVGVKVVLGILSVICLGGAGALGYVYYKNLKEGELTAGEFGVSTTEELKNKLDVIAEARRKRDTIAGNTQSAKAALERAKEDYDLAKSTLAKTYMRWNELPPTGDINAAFDELEERVKSFLATKAKLHEEKTTLELTVKEIRRTLSDKSEIDIRAQVSPLRRKALCQENYDDIISGIAEAKEIIEEQQRLAFTVENELASLKLRATDPGELYSKIQALDTKINELRAKHKAYFVALRALDSASDNLRAEISPRLGEFATELLSVMTERKYSELGIDEGLKVNFKTPEGNERSVDYLSGGTRDLTYIAVRMALIDMLYTEKPPICFDETFASQDNIRAESMMKAIGKLADDGYQSFIFTCRAREAALASERSKDSGIFRLSVTAD